MNGLRHGKKFKIANVDTDSISICWEDMAPISPEERVQLLGELNAMFPDRIRFEDDGYYPTVIVIKAKNYVLFDGKKLKYKGSALKATTKEPALQEFIQKVIGVLAEKSNNTEDTTHQELKTIYDTFAHEIQNITNIKRWATRKTITDKVLNAQRTNEQRVKDAIIGSEYVEGDRAYFFFLPDGTQCLVENFIGEYNREKLLEKLYKTAEIFDTILPVKTLFPNYKLKRSKKLLEQLSLF